MVRIHLQSLTTILSLLALPLIASSTDQASSPVNQAKNLARMNCGAQIDCIAPDGTITHVTPAAPEHREAAALIMDDDSVSCSLREGETNFVIALPNAALLDRLTFLNENGAARGELTIAVSNSRLPARSPKWMPVEGAIRFENKRAFDLSLLGIEAKFVRLCFRVEKQGRIAALGLYGEQSLNDFAARQEHIALVSNAIQASREVDRVNFNFANAYARARIAYVSSGTGKDAGKMIDDDPITAYQFDKNDPHPIVVIELPETQQLHRVSAIYDMTPGRIDVYALDKLCGDPEELEGLKPIAVALDRTGEGKASVEFDPHGARFIALRWTPANVSHTRSFHVAEVNAFGNVRLADINMDERPQLFASNTLQGHALPGEGPADFSNTLGTLADPPTVPPVSP